MKMVNYIPNLILATGHSARDVLSLDNHQIKLEVNHLHLVSELNTNRTY